MRKQKVWMERVTVDKKAERERKRLILEANKQLISAPKKTMKSMGLVSFDPSGAFCFEQGRWVKVYEVTGSIERAPEVALKTNSRIRITERIDYLASGRGKEKFYISLIAKGDLYEEVRALFAEDERILQEMIGVRTLTVDETMEKIFMVLGKERSFSYASFVRSGKDLLREITPDITEKTDHFSIGGTFGISMFLKQYPGEVTQDTLSLLGQLGCPVILTFDLVGVDAQDKEDYVRTLEKMYARTLSSDSVEDFLNVSGQITLLCDSKDALEIVLKTAVTIFNRNGYLLSPLFAAQKESFLSQVSLGLLDYKILRNVSVKTMEDIFRREYGDKDKIRTDEAV